MDTYRMMKIIFSGAAWIDIIIFKNRTLHKKLIELILLHTRLTNTKEVHKLTCYAYQYRAGEDLSQNDHVVRVLDGFREF